MIAQHQLGEHAALLARIGAALDLARRQKGWSVEEWARRAGASHVTIARLMRPKPFDSMGLRTISRLADALNLSIDVLLRERRP